VPNVKELKDKILHEAHESAYSIHLGGNKMYHDLKVTYWWYGIKRDIVEYVALLRHLSASQSPASMTCWITSDVASARVEVGRDCHGFYRGFAKNSVGL
jgi:hypothetical protein